MKKISEVYNKVVQWLCNFGSDKWLHLIVGLMVSFLGAVVFATTTKNGDMVTYAFCGWCVATAVGLGKEIIDFFHEGDFDGADCLFTMLGGVIGAVIYMI